MWWSDCLVFTITKPCTKVKRTVRQFNVAFAVVDKSTLPSVSRVQTTAVNLLRRAHRGTVWWPEGTRPFHLKVKAANRVN